MIRQKINGPILPRWLQQGAVLVLLFSKVSYICIVVATALASAVFFGYMNLFFPSNDRHLFTDKLYVVGGSDGTASLATVEIYDPVTQMWSFGPVMSIPRANVGVAVVGKRLFAVGGFSGKAFLDSVEYLAEDGSEWCCCVPLPDSEQKMNNAKQRIDINSIEKIPSVANGNVDTKAIKKPQNTSVAKPVQNNSIAGETKQAKAST